MLRPSGSRCAAVGRCGGATLPASRHPTSFISTLWYQPCLGASHYSSSRSQPPSLTLASLHLQPPCAESTHLPSGLHPAPCPPAPPSPNAPPQAANKKALELPAGTGSAYEAVAALPVQAAALAARVVRCGVGGTAPACGPTTLMPASCCHIRYGLRPSTVALLYTCAGPPAPRHKLTCAGPPPVPSPALNDPEHPASPPSGNRRTCPT